MDNILSAMDLDEKILKQLRFWDQKMGDYPRNFWTQIYQDLSLAQNEEEQIKILAAHLSKYNEYAILYIQLKLLPLTKKEYHRHEISPKIYKETMAYFSREIHDSMNLYSKSLYPQPMWGFRHLFLKIFRIGSLEYEIFDQSQIIKIHIPSNAEIDKTSRYESYQGYLGFVEKHFPEKKHYQIECTTWFLAPKLQELLGEGSKIRSFQEDFKLIGHNPDDKSYKKWVFQNYPGDIKNYPSKTKLQKKMQSHIVSKGDADFAVHTGVLKQSILKESMEER